MLGFFIFSESLPPLWFLGAALLVAGNVIIGRREEGEDKTGQTDGGEARDGGEEAESLLRGESFELEAEEAIETRRRRREDEDMLDLGENSEEDKSDEELI